MPRPRVARSCIHHLRQQEDRIKNEIPDGASIGADSSNACVWVATIFGRAETLWDGGMFQVELVFPPDFPDAPPFVHFLTPIFHPQVSPQGVPYMRSLVMWHHIEPKGKTVSALLQQLVTLLSVEPSPEPVTHLNVEVGRPPRAHDAPRREMNPSGAEPPVTTGGRRRRCTSRATTTRRSRTSGR